MNGFTFKTAAQAFTLLSMIFLASLTVASSTTNESDKTKIYRSQLGCMSCHQGEAKVAPKNQAHLQQAQAAKAG